MDKAQINQEAILQCRLRSGNEKNLPNNQEMILENESQF